MFSIVVWVFERVGFGCFLPPRHKDIKEHKEEAEGAGLSRLKARMTGVGGLVYCKRD